MTSTLEPSQPPVAAGKSRIQQLVRSALVGAVLGAILIKLLGGTDAHPARREALRHALDGGFPPAMIASLGLWIVLSVYWELAARHASQPATRESGASRALHLALVGAGQLVLLLPIPGLRARWVAPLPAVIAVGLAIEVAAVAFSIWARRTLGRHWSGAITTKVGHELIRSGPYRWVRHPIYTGMFALSIGTALVSGEMHTLVGFALLIVAFARKIALEERLLARTFGAEWQDYRATTKAVVPGIL